MASLQSTIELIFSGIDDTGDAIASISSGLSTVTNKVGAVTGPLADATKKILAFEAGVAAAGAALAVYSASQAQEFEQRFRELTTLIDEPIENLVEFRQSILDYAQTSTKSLDEIIRSLYNAISAGTDYTDSLEIVRQAEQLAVAGNAQLDESLVGLVSTLNAYGLSADEAARFSDILFTTVKNGQTTLPELNASLANVTGLAATAGVSFEEIAAAVATLTATGTPTSQAITQIQGAISALLKPSSEAATLAGELGIEFDANALKSKGLTGVLDEVANVVGDNTGQMAKLFGRVEALNGVLTLTGIGADKFSSNLDAMNSSAGNTETAFAKMNEVLDTGASALQVLFIQLGDPLLDAFFNTKSAITDITNALADALQQEGALSGFTTVLQGFSENIEATIRAIAENLPEALESADFSAFFDGIEAVSEAINNLLGGIDLTTVEGLEAAIEGLGSVFNQLAQFTAGAIEGIGPFLAQAAELAKVFIELDPSIFSVAGQIGGVSIAINTLLPVVNTALLGFLTFGTNASSAGAALAGMSGTIAALLPLLGKATLVGAVGALAFELTRVSGAGQAVADAVPPGFWDKLFDSIPGLSENVGELNSALEETPSAIDAQVKSAEVLRKQIEANLEVNESALETEQDRRRESYELAKALEAQGFAYNSLTGEITDLAQVQSDVAGGANAFAAALFEQQRAAEGAAQSAQGYRLEIVDGVKTYTQVGGALDKVTDSTDKTGEAMKKATEETDSFRLKMEEIASNERIKNLEFAVDLKVAEFEADAKRIEAITETLNTQFESTGEVLAESFKILSKFTDDTVLFGVASEIFELAKRQIELENEIRQQASKDAHELVQAELLLLEEKRRRLASGDSLIKISMNGVEPELELIMWKIIERVQMRVNAEAADFLLGAA